MCVAQNVQPASFPLTSPQFELKEIDVNYM